MKEKFFDDFVPTIAYHVFRKCNPGWQIRQYPVNDYDITYIIKGGARYIINGAIHELEAGDLLCLTKGATKEAFTYPKNLMHCFGINFTSKYPPSKKKETDDDLFPMVSHIGIRQDIINMFRELTISWTEQQSGYIMKTRALLMMILHRLSEIILYEVDSAPSDYRISRVTRYISMHYSEKLTVKNLASHVHLNPDYCGRLFKRETGMMIHQYLTRTRVRNAENMLQSGNYKIHEVAEQCGFSDVFHFYKSFRALRGFPPSRCIPKDRGRQ